MQVILVALSLYSGFTAQNIKCICATGGLVTDSLVFCALRESGHQSAQYAALSIFCRDNAIVYQQTNPFLKSSQTYSVQSAYRCRIIHLPISAVSINSLRFRTLCNKAWPCLLNHGPQEDHIIKYTPMPAF